jgi:hypothetical protein
MRAAQRPARPAADAAKVAKNRGSRAEAAPADRSAIRDRQRYVADRYGPDHHAHEPARLIDLGSAAE